MNQEPSHLRGYSELEENAVSERDLGWYGHYLQPKLTDEKGDLSA